MTMNETTPLVTPDEIVNTSALESIHRAEVDTQITTARRYPRIVQQVKKDMLSFATLDEETASACFYSLPRGGKNIQGPSVRLAEIAVSCYGNLRVGSRIIQTVTTGENHHVVVQAIAHDLEKNVAVTIEKRRRITKKRNKDYVDEDDINLAANAGAAIAFRDAVFKVVPQALIKPILDAAKKVAVGDMKSLVSRRNKMVDAFSKMGVTPDRILAVIGKKSVDEIDLGDMETLLGLHNAIKDGQTSVEDAFPMIAKTPVRPTAMPDPVPTATPTDTSIVTAETDFKVLIETLESLMEKDSVTHEQLMKWAVAKKLAKEGQAKEDLATKKLADIINGWETILPQVKG